MNKIFWGLIFLFFNINIGSISILPAFVGYILIFMGMKDYPQVERFGKCRPWAVAGVVLSAITWLPIVNLQGIPMLLGTSFQLMVTYWLAVGMVELEGLYGIELGAMKLCKVWNVMAVGLIASVILAFLLQSLAAIAMLVGMIAGIIYVVTFYRCKSRFPAA